MTDAAVNKANAAEHLVSATLGDMIRDQERIRHIFGDLAQERLAQIRKWGGRAHDDLHSHEAWSEFIAKQLSYYKANNDRSRLVKIAALAVAALESFDRNAEKAIGEQS
jgi:hypothetical protein